jgi:hypothetical protein
VYSKPSEAILLSQGLLMLEGTLDKAGTCYYFSDWGLNFTPPLLGGVNFGFHSSRSRFGIKGQALVNIAFI